MKAEIPYRKELGFSEKGDFYEAHQAAWLSIIFVSFG